MLYVGEEDQDAYDINRLKKPVGTAGVCAPDNSLRKPHIEELPKTTPQKPVRMHCEYLSEMFGIQVPTKMLWEDSP